MSSIKNFSSLFSGILNPLKISSGKGISWSQKPGCFERHLQRRYKNPLFQEDRRQITDKELKQARNLDNNEQKLFRNEKLLFEQKIGSLKQEGFNIELLLYKDVQALIEKGYSIGGNIDEDIAKIEQIEKSMYAQLNKNDPQLKEFLDEVNALSSVKRVPYFACLSRKDKPIRKDEELPSLLCEDYRAIISLGICSRVFSDFRPNQEDFIQAVNEAISQKVITRNQADDYIKAWTGNLNKG